MTDPINSPRHYTAHKSGIECIQLTECLSFNIGNAVKYVWRADEKGRPIEDLKKALWYLERELSRPVVSGLLPGVDPVTFERIQYEVVRAERGDDASVLGELLCCLPPDRRKIESAIAGLKVAIERREATP